MKNFKQHLNNIYVTAGKVLLLVIPLALMPLNAAAGIAMGQSGRPDSAKKCAICHFQWIYSFYTEHRDGELLNRSAEPVVASKRMCISCHDGSVADSRELIFGFGAHTAGTVPSKHVTMPDESLLDENGKLECATCHSPHSLEASSGKISEVFMRQSNKNSAYCMSCHPGNTGGRIQGNHTVGVSCSVEGAAIVQNGGKFGTGDQQKQIVCETCHFAHARVKNKSLIVGIGKNRSQSKLCEVCHEHPMGKLSKIQRSHPVDIKPHKAHVPAQWANGTKVVYGSGGKIVCMTCHKTHKAADKNSLLADSNQRDLMCRQCHVNERSITGSQHDLRLSAPAQKNIRGVSAERSGPCAPCHVAHNGGRKLLWAGPAKIGQNSIDGLCAGCHSKGQCASKKQPGKYSHPMDVTVKAAANRSRLPVFDRNSRRASSGSMRCVTCHDIHNPAPLYSGGDVPGKKQGLFLRGVQADQKELCEGCHWNYKGVSGTDHDLTMSRPEYSNKTGQKVVKNGTCSACHSAHNARSENYIWSAPFGKTRFAGWDEDFSHDKDNIVSMCTGCHTEKKWSGSLKYGLHPAGLALTENNAVNRVESVGDKFPLYDENGRLSSSGNIVCSTCHDPHSWSSSHTEKGPGQLVEGDATNSFLRKGIEEKFCATCHGEDSIVKFMYFHSIIGREKKESPFPLHLKGLKK